MVSQLTEAMIVNGVVLATVLASSAGWPYAAFWTLVVGARAAFSYGAAHWFTNSIVTWCITNQVSEAAITDGLVFMAITMIIVRTAGLRLRAARRPEAAAVPRPRPVAA
jgi:hypothetical protein